MFILYMADLVAKHRMNFHSFADDSQTYLASPLKTITDELQRVLNAAARLISGTGKYDRGLSRLFHDELHWLYIPQRVQ